MGTTSTQTLAGMSTAVPTITTLTQNALEPQQSWLPYQAPALPRIGVAGSAARTRGCGRAARVPAV